MNMSKNPNDIMTMPYAQWLEQTLRDLTSFSVKGICISAVTDTGDTYANYYNISMNDKLVLSGIINQDATLDMLMNNGFIKDEDEEDMNDEEEE